MSIQHVQQFARAASLIAPQCAQEIAALATAPERNEQASIDAGLQCVEAFHAGADKGKPFPFAGGIAVIPVWGALLHRDRWCNSWATGYSYIESRFAAAIGDDDVKGILFDINSYGGHVAGNFELCEQIYAARGKKPMMALVDSRSLSGGYSIGSAVGRMVATPSSDIGSVGVVLMHMSFEEMMKQAGVEVSFIYAGKHKVDGNPYQDLPDDVRAALQASVEKSYEKFVSLVARNRGIDPEVVRKTEARVYDAEEAKALGLIDEVAAPKDAFASFLSEVSTASTLAKEVKTMSTQNSGAGGGNDAPVDENAIRQAASKAEQTRIAGIIGADEAKGREALANHFAFSTTMSAEDAVAALAAAPKAEAAAPTPAAPATSALAAAMAATGGGAGVLPEGGGDEEEGKSAQGGGLLKAASDLGYVNAKTH